MSLTTIALTMGDPAGIGPEIIMKALATPGVHAFCKPLVIGDAERLRLAGQRVGTQLQLVRRENVREAAHEHGKVECIDLGLVPADLPFGQVSPIAGEAAYRYIERAVRIVEEGLRSNLNAGGGKLAADLGNLYAYIAQRLTHANLRNDPAALDECQGLLEPLRQAWAAIAPAAESAGR